MKRSFVPLLALLLCLLLTACDTLPDASDASVPEGSTTTSTTASSTTTTTTTEADATTTTTTTAAPTTTTTTAATTTTTTTTAAPTTTTTTTATITTTTKPAVDPLTKLQDPELQEAMANAGKGDVIYVSIELHDLSDERVEALKTTAEWKAATSTALRQRLIRKVRNQLFLDTYVAQIGGTVKSHHDLSDAVFMELTVEQIHQYARVDMVEYIIQFGDEIQVPG